MTLQTHDSVYLRDFGSHPGASITTSCSSVHTDEETVTPSFLAVRLDDHSARLLTKSPDSDPSRMTGLLKNGLASASEIVASDIGRR
jgi:hypothetical protein